jgi:hypothetical protein
VERVVAYIKTLLLLPYLPGWIGKGVMITGPSPEFASQLCQLAW